MHCTDVSQLRAQNYKKRKPNLSRQGEIHVILRDVDHSLLNRAVHNMLNCPLTSDPDLVHCCRLHLVAVVVVASDVDVIIIVIVV